MKISQLTAVCALAFVANAWSSCSLSQNSAREFEIANYSDLKQVGVGSCSGDSVVFRFTQDIDASASQTENGGLGFPVIQAYSYPYAFKTLHGGGHVIDHLFIHDTTTMNANVGLVGTMTSSQTIDSLGLTHADISDTSGSASVGGLVGIMFGGHLSNCFVMGRITGNGNDASIGGLVGDFAATSDTLRNVFTQGSAINLWKNPPYQGQDFVGGIAGASEGVIENSFSMDSVVGNNYVGGLVGGPQGSVVNSYSLGSVVGSQNGTCVGGIFGFGNPTVKHSYSTAKIIGPSAVAGILGVAYPIGDYTLQDYFDTTLTDMTSAIGNTPTTTSQGLSSAQMRDSANFAGFSFAPDSAWKIYQDKSDPLLRNIPNPPILWADTLSLSSMNNFSSLLLASSSDSSHSLVASIDSIIGSALDTANGNFAFASGVTAGSSDSIRIRMGIIINGLDTLWGPKAWKTLAYEPLTTSVRSKSLSPLQGSTDVEIYSLQGRKVWSGQLEVSQEHIQFPQLGSGNWIVRMRQGTNFATALIARP